MKRIQLLVVACSNELAKKIAELAAFSNTAEVKPLCPPTLEGFLKSLTMNFPYAHSVLITADAFANVGVVKVIQEIKKANQHLRVYVYRTGGMVDVKTSDLTKAGAYGAYATSIMKNKDFIDWITRALNKDTPSFFVERVKGSAGSILAPLSSKSGASELSEGRDTTNGTSQIAPKQSTLPKRAPNPGPKSPIHGVRFDGRGGSKSRVASFTVPEQSGLAAVWTKTNPSPPPALKAETKKEQVTASNVTRTEEAQQITSHPMQSVVAVPSLPNSRNVALLHSEIRQLVKVLLSTSDSIDDEVVLEKLKSGVNTLTEKIVDKIIPPKAKAAPVSNEQRNQTEQGHFITIAPFSKAKTLIKFGKYDDFKLSHQYAKVFELLVLAKGKAVSVANVQEALNLEYRCASNLLFNTTKAVIAAVPQFKGCITNVPRHGYCFVPPAI